MENTENTENTEITAEKAAASEEVGVKAPETVTEKAEDNVEATKSQKDNVKTPAQCKAEKFAKVKVALNEIVAAFPKAFFLEGPAKPLKIGIFNDVVAKMAEKGSALSKTIIRAALRYYTTRWNYLDSVKENVKRIDIDGNELDAVSAEHASFAAKELEESKAQFEKFREAKKAARRRFHAAHDDKNKTENGAEKADGKPSEGRKFHHSHQAANGAAAGAASADGEKRPRRHFQKRFDGQAPAKKHFASKPGFVHGPKKSVVVSTPREDFVALPQTDIKQGSKVHVLFGSGAVDATVREVVHDQVTVELASGMAIKVTADKIGH